MPRHPQTETPGRMPSDIDDDKLIWPDDVEITDWQRLMEKLRLAANWIDDNCELLSGFQIAHAPRDQITVYFADIQRDSQEDRELLTLFRGHSARIQTHTGGSDLYTIKDDSLGLAFQWRVCGHVEESSMRDEVVVL